MADLEKAKRRLSEILKDSIQKYWDLMKSWYRRKITKENFDSKAKTLLGESNVHLHNEFLFAILVKCQTGDHPDAPHPVAATACVPPPPVSTPVPKASPPPPPSVGRPKLRKQQRLSPPTEIPYGALDILQYHTPPKVQITGRDLDSIMLCAHDLMLPDFATLHTRMLLLAWEAGLDGVSEESAKLLMLSLQCHLKNVIQTLIAHQCSWRAKRNGQFQHSFGSGLTSTALSSSSTMTNPANAPLGPADQQPSPTSSATINEEEPIASNLREISSSVQPMNVGEAELAMVASRATMNKHLEPLTLFHLRDALMLNHQCIPVHSVYACNMERISAMMWHPSREEEQQQRTVEQWKKSLQRKPPFTISNAAFTVR